MGKMMLFTALAALAAMPSTAHAGDAPPSAKVGRWRPYIDEASIRFGIPTLWIERVIGAESGGEPMLDGRPIRSRAGAMGLMQLMPATWEDMRARLGLGPDPDDPRDNILAGTFYLRLMYNRFGYPGLFGAYNAGPAAYAAWREGRRNLPAETIAYIANVAEQPAPALRAAARSRAPAPLFVVRKAAADALPSEGAEGRQDAIFAIRRPRR